MLSSLPPDFAAEIKAGGGAPNTRVTQPPSGSSTAVPAPSSLANDDSNLNGDSMDVTQNSELNADDTQNAIDLLHSGPNYAYIVSINNNLACHFKQIENVITGRKRGTKGKLRKQRYNNFSCAAAMAQMQLNQFDY